MEYLLLAGLIVLGIFILIIILTRRPYYHKNVTLKQIDIYIRALLKRGRDGGFIIVEDMNSKRFVQFAKYIRKKGDIGLESSFPKAPWSEQYYEKVKEFLRKENIPFIIQAVDSEPVTEFIEIDCYTDVDLACRLVEGIFSHVFLIKEPLFRIRGENISAKDELIDSDSRTA